MRFKLGFLTGFGAGYYLGSAAGRERYVQINQSLRKLRRSDTFEDVTDTVKTTVAESVDTAKDLVESKVGNGSSGEDAPPNRFS